MSAAAVLSALSAAAEPEQVTLEYKYNVGERVVYAIATTGSGTVTLTGIPGGPAEGMKIPMEFNHEVTLETKTLEVSDKDVADLEYSVTLLSMESSARGTKSLVLWTPDHVRLLVNGEERDVPDSLKQSLGWVGKPFRLKVTKLGKVVEADWSALEKISKALSGMNLKQMVQSGRPVLPDKPVKSGDTWTQTMNVPLPGAAGKQGSVVMNMEYTYVDMEPFKDKPCAKVLMTGTMTMDGVQLTNAGGMGMMPKGAKMSIDAMNSDIDGVLYFDPEAGRSVQQELNMDVSITTTVSGNNPQGNAFEITSDTSLKLKNITRAELQKDETKAQGEDEEEEAETPAAKDADDQDGDE